MSFTATILGYLLSGSTLHSLTIGKNIVTTSVIKKHKPLTYNLQSTMERTKSVQYVAYTEGTIGIREKKKKKELENDIAH